jgi:hypothetical protein
LILVKSHWDSGKLQRFSKGAFSTKLNRAFHTIEEHDEALRREVEISNAEGALAILMQIT